MLRKITLGKSHRYIGFKKIYQWKNIAAICHIKKTEHRVIDADLLFKVCSRREDMKMPDDFLDLVTVSYAKVKKRFGQRFADRLSYTPLEGYVVVDITETKIEKNGGSNVEKQ